MNCQEVEKQIVLFAELTGDEKEKVASHLKTCRACQEVFDSMAYTKSLVNRAAKVDLLVADPVSLTNSIMGQLKRTEPQRWKLDLSFLRMEFTYVKYGLASITLFLTVLLGVEQFRIPNEFNKVAVLSPQNNSNTIVLNREAFQKELRKSKATGTFSLANNCRSPFKINRINAACFKQRMNF